MAGEMPDVIRRAIMAKRHKKRMGKPLGHKMPDGKMMADAEMKKMMK